MGIDECHRQDACATDGKRMSEEAIQVATPLGRTETRPPSRSFVGHAKVISGFTLLSRILGVVRESFAAKYFGAGLVSSAFYFAFAIPNLFRRLFGEGALSAAFIPLYSEIGRAHV